MNCWLKSQELVGESLKLFGNEHFYEKNSPFLDHLDFIRFQMARTGWRSLQKAPKLGEPHKSEHFYEKNSSSSETWIFWSARSGLAGFRNGLKG